MNTLASQFRAFNRQIYASLPWGYRVAGLILKLSFSLTDALGKVIYFELIKAKVDGMPDVNGAPAAEFLEKHPRNPDRLPTGYGRKLAERVYATLLRKLRNPNQVEEVISEYFTTVARKGIPVPAGTPLAQAERYVMKSVTNALMDFIRTQNGRTDRGEKRPDLKPTDDASMINMADPNAFKELDSLLPENELRWLMKDLEMINPRAPSWLEAQLEGLSGVELAAEWGVGKSAISMWERQYVPHIKKLVLDYVREAAA